MEQEQKKSILIIKANTQSLLAAEGFLRNRDWKIKSTSNLKEALIYLVQEQPAFVMISVDHPNKKVQKLPKVLAAAFPCCVIAFAEESSTASYKTLSATPTEYQIYPPITGPAIERMVNKYYKDLLTKPAASAAQRAAGEGDDANSTISIKGSNGFNAANAQSLLAQMMSGDGGDLTLGDTNSSPNSFSTTGSNGAGGMNFNLSGSNSSTSTNTGTNSNSVANSNSSSNSNGNGKSDAHMPQRRTGPIESAFEQMNADAERALAEKNAKKAAYVPPVQKPGAQGNSAAYAPPEPTSGQQGKTPSTAANLESSSTKGTSKGHLQKGAAFGKVDLAKEGTGSNGKAATEENQNATSSRSAKSQGAAWGPAAVLAGKNKERPGRETDDDSTANAEEESLISRGTTAALDRSCIQLSKQHNQGIELTSNMACIVIESSRFSGYLITAMGKNKVIDEAFMKKIQMRLYNFLKDHGEKVTHGESLQLILRQVPFMPWALDQAEFLRRSTHMGDEVAMAFFPRAEIRARFGESVDEEMAAVQLHEFEGDTKVDFNVYIHLPKNNKYVLYTPRGGVFYDRQKERLSGQGVSHLHVLKAEIQDLDKYRAENYLNDSIDEFNKKDRLKKTG